MINKVENFSYLCDIEDNIFYFVKYKMKNALIVRDLNIIIFLAKKEHGKLDPVTKVKQFSEHFRR